MDFSEQFRRLYARGPQDVDKRILPFLIDLTNTPGQTRVLLGREFTRGVHKQGIIASYNGIFGALDVSVSVNGYGRRVQVFVDRKDSDRAIQYVRGLNRKLKS
jgi:hypothetical protein